MKQKQACEYPNFYLILLGKIHCLMGKDKTSFVKLINKSFESFEKEMEYERHRKKACIEKEINRIKASLESYRVIDSDRVSTDHKRLSSLEEDLIRLKNEYDDMISHQRSVTDEKIMKYRGIPKRKETNYE